MLLLRPTGDVRSAALLTVAAFAGKQAGKTPWGQRVTPPIVAMACATAFSNVGWLPLTSRAHDACWDVCLPASLSLVLLAQKVVDGSGSPMGRTGASFAAGALGSCVGAVATFAACRSMLPAHVLAPAVCSLFASYVGGSANFFAVSKATNASPDLASALAAADVGVMALYFAGLSFLAGGSDAQALVAETPSPRDLAAAAVAASLCLFVARRAASGRAGLFTGFIAVSSIALNALARRFRVRLAAAPLADVCLLLFYSALGANANADRVCRVGAAALVLAVAVLVGHACVLAVLHSAAAGGARYFKRLRDKAPTLAETLVASNACIGGPSTAAAFAAAIGQPSLVLPAVVWGTVGYAVATSAGIALCNTLLLRSSVIA